MKLPLASSLVAAVALAFAAGAARAEESTGYAGLSLGMVSFPTADDRPMLAGTDTSLATGNIYLGGRFNEFLGIEAGYLKSAEGDVRNSAGDGLGDYDVNTLYGALVGRIPTGGGITPFAKIGFHRWNIRGNVRVVGPERTFSGTDLMFGAGIDWMVGESWDVRVEYMHLPFDDAMVGKDKLHAFLIGVHRRF